MSPIKLIKQVRLTFLLVLAGVSLRVTAQQYRITINPSSRITVFGATNVNQFKFRYTEAISINRPVNVIRQQNTLNLSNCTIDLKIHAFDSGNPIMNNDFRKMLNEKKNPFISVSLLTLSPRWQANGSWQTGTVDVLITINNLGKKITFNCKLENPESLFIYGRERISLTEFDLTPPTRMMGMVRVSEWVDIDLALRFGTDG
jgi:hypothetical protein